MVNFSKGNKKSVIGLDIGSRSTKVVQLAFSGSSKPALVRCDFLPTGHLDESFNANMKSYLSEHKLTNAMVAASFENDSLKIRKLELPKMPELDLIEAMRWNLRDVVEGDIEEFSVEYSMVRDAVDGDENTQVEVMAYAAKTAEVNKFRQQLEKLGLHPFMIEPAAVTLASALERCHPDDEHYQAGLDIGSQQSTFYVVGNGIFVFSRPMKGVSLELQQKEPENFAKNVAIELQKSIDTFAVSFKMQTIHHLYLSGGGALVDGLIDYMRTNLGIETDPLDSFRSLTGLDRYPEAKPELFAQAVSLAYLQP